MVGKTGFEPATPWSQTRCTTKLCYFPTNGALGRNRTSDTRIFSPLLYRLSYGTMAVWTGLEPATSAVTGRHSNQLNYQTILVAGEGFEPTTFGL